MSETTELHPRLEVTKIADYLGTSPKKLTTALARMFLGGYLIELIPGAFVKVIEVTDANTEPKLRDAPGSTQAVTI